MDAGKAPPAFAAPIRKPARLRFGRRCRLAARLRRAMRGRRAREHEHSKRELDAPSASQATESCKQQSSSAVAGGLTAGIGQRESRRPRWLRVHAPAHNAGSRPFMTSRRALAISAHLVLASYLLAAEPMTEVSLSRGRRASGFTSAPARRTARAAAPRSDLGRRVGGRRPGTARLADWSGVASRRRFEPCVRFSRTRLSDIVHRLAYASVGFTVPVRR